jgi:hypothetical protein
VTWATARSRNAEEASTATGRIDGPLKRPKFLFVAAAIVQTRWRTRHALGSKTTYYGADSLPRNQIPSLPDSGREFVVPARDTPTIRSNCARDTEKGLKRSGLCDCDRMECSPMLLAREQAP